MRTWRHTPDLCYYLLIVWEPIIELQGVFNDIKTCFDMIPFDCDLTTLFGFCSVDGSNRSTKRIRCWQEV